MHPRLLTTPLFTVHTFGLLLASAYVAAFWWLIREGRREGLNVDELSSLGFWADRRHHHRREGVDDPARLPGVRGGAVRNVLAVGARERR
jgi:hypothetical protein